jgi:acetylornithine deacetylase/succinyl-diaminopimelate desuccinylase family protein
MIDQKHLIKLTQALIRIRSDNPPGDEYRIARFVKAFLEDLGLKPRIYEFRRNRSNVVVVLRGKEKNHSLLVTPHLDTVPAGTNWRFPPFAAVLRNGRIYGRGASDDKGNLAIALETIRSLVKQGHVLSYNLVFAATADEETGSRLGLVSLLDKGICNPEAALVLDADEFKIVVAQKGLIHLKVKIRGKSAHGAYPWQGINAIDQALKALSEIKSHKFVYKRNPYLRSPTINIGRIAGGDKVNIVADWCEFELDVRFLPGMSASKIIQDIRRIIKNYTKEFKIEIETVQLPTQIDCHHPLVGYLKKAIHSSLAPSFKRHRKGYPAGLKISPRITGSEGATVITFFQNRNIPAVATGFACSGCAHSKNEYIRIDYLYKGAKVLEDFLKNFRFS